MPVQVGFSPVMIGSTAGEVLNVALNTLVEDRPWASVAVMVTFELPTDVEFSVIVLLDPEPPKVIPAFGNTEVFEESAERVTVAGVSSVMVNEIGCADWLRQMVGLAIVETIGALFTFLLYFAMKLPVTFTAGD